MASVIATCDQSVPKTTPNIAPPTADKTMRGNPIDTNPVPTTAKASQGHPPHWASHCWRFATLSDVLPWLQGVKVSSHVERMRNPTSNKTRQTSFRAERAGAVGVAFVPPDAGSDSCMPAAMLFRRPWSLKQQTGLPQAPLSGTGTACPQHGRLTNAGTGCPHPV